MLAPGAHIRHSTERWLTQAPSLEIPAYQEPFIQCNFPTSFFSQFPKSNCLHSVSHFCLHFSFPIISIVFSTMNLVLDSPPSLCGSSQSNHLVPSTLECSLLAHNRWLSDSIPFFLYKSESLCPRIKSVNLAHRHHS